MSDWSDGYVVDVPYTYGIFCELTPSLLSLVALNAGVRVPSANETAAYCELGCGLGFTANVLAATHPHVEFHAVDFNPSHVVAARDLAHAAGLDNVHFHDDSFEEFNRRSDLPKFDFITLHGVYSWISAESRATVVRFIRERLKPGGIVYVSYNARPGINAMIPLRDLMIAHARSVPGGATDKLRSSLHFIERLAATNPLHAKASPQFNELIANIKGKEPAYLIHEYMNRSWDSFYHHDVVAEMAGAKLDYVGSAQILSQLDVINISPEQAAFLAEIKDRAVRETVRDYVINSQFRRDVFVRGAARLSPVEVRDRWLDHRFALTVHRDKPTLTIKGARGEATLQSSVYGPILDRLADGPCTLRQISSLSVLSHLGMSQLTEAMLILVGQGGVQPALDAKGDAKRQQRSKAFNAVVLEKAKGSGDLGHLVSPVTGFGVPVGRVSQLFCLARQAKSADPAQFAWDHLQTTGQRLARDGRTIESLEENLQELRHRHEAFMRDEYPLLQKLAVV